jgi:hypothetical protein
MAKRMKMKKSMGKRSGPSRASQNYMRNFVIKYPKLKYGRGQRAMKGYKWKPSYSKNPPTAARKYSGKRDYKSNRFPKYRKSIYASNPMAYNSTSILGRHRKYNRKIRSLYDRGNASRSFNKGLSKVSTIRPSGVVHLPAGSYTYVLNDPVVFSNDFKKQLQFAELDADFQRYMYKSVFLVNDLDELNESEELRCRLKESKISFSNAVAENGVIIAKFNRPFNITSKTMASFRALFDSSAFLNADKVLACYHNILVGNRTYQTVLSEIYGGTAVNFVGFQTFVSENILKIMDHVVDGLINNSGRATCIIIKRGRNDSDASWELVPTNLLSAPEQYKFLNSLTGYEILPGSTMETEYTSLMRKFKEIDPEFKKSLQALLWGGTKEHLGLIMHLLYTLIVHFKSNFARMLEEYINPSTQYNVSFFKSLRELENRDIIQFEMIYKNETRVLYPSRDSSAIMIVSLKGITIDVKQKYELDVTSLYEMVKPIKDDDVKIKLFHPSFINFCYKVFGFSKFKRSVFD